MSEAGNDIYLVALSNALRPSVSFCSAINGALASVDSRTEVSAE